MTAPKTFVRLQDRVVIRKGIAKLAQEDGTTREKIGYGRITTVGDQSDTERAYVEVMLDDEYHPQWHWIEPCNCCHFTTPEQ